jgi:hypothetical protein
VLIEVGAKKGNYMCIHKRPPQTGSGRSGFSSVPHSAEAIAQLHEETPLEPVTEPSIVDTSKTVDPGKLRAALTALGFSTSEYDQIHSVLRPENA